MAAAIALATVIATAAVTAAVVTAATSTVAAAIVAAAAAVTVVTSAATAVTGSAPVVTALARSRSAATTGIVGAASGAIFATTLRIHDLWCCTAIVVPFLPVVAQDLSGLGIEDHFPFKTVARRLQPRPAEQGAADLDAGKPLIAQLGQDRVLHGFR